MREGVKEDTGWSVDMVHHDNADWVVLSCRDLGNRAAQFQAGFAWDDFVSFVDWLNAERTTMRQKRGELQ